MRKMVLVVSVATVMVTTTPTAQAHPEYDYEGGCGQHAMSDGTDSSSTRWQAAGYVVIIATDARTGLPDFTAELHVECELRINGATPGTIVFTAHGRGYVIAPAPWTYYADPDDTITICDHVTVVDEFHKHCEDYDSWPLIPEPIQELVDSNRQALDAVVCGITAPNDNTVIDEPPAFEIRSDGDVYVVGQWIWDCPPYNSSGA